MNNDYLRLRPYRKKDRADRTDKMLTELMERRFEKGFDSYWEQFGYEIGGPVCCGYVDWLGRELARSSPEVTDIAFVARDGWLLKQVYELLPARCAAKGHYIYAPRTLTLRCQEESALKEYREYLARQGLFPGRTTAVVDTVTLKFSSQRLIDAALGGGTHGFYWVVLDRDESFCGDFRFCAYQKERFQTMRSWNLMEFIMTSPEPSIKAMQNGEPVYREANEAEKRREALFPQLEAGVLQFAADLLAAGDAPELDNAFVTRWVNEFLKHPDRSDKEAFRDVCFSEREDHSDSIPLDPFGQNGLPRGRREWKEKIWFFSQRYPWLYRALHGGNTLRKRIDQSLRGVFYTKYKGGKPWELADILAGYDVVSFDIFDTLLRRNVKRPTDLFCELERQNGLAGFHDNRILAERDARRARGRNGEADIFDIYAELAPKYGQDGEAMLQRELAAERNACRADEEMKEVVRILKEKGVRMIAVSDMYLPSDFLRELLSGCGYEGFERVFVSCEHGAGKTGGALQRMVSAELGESLRYVHIGDNMGADVQGSRKAGWNTIWYKQRRKR